MINEEVNMLNINNASLIDESLLLEKTRQELINKTRNSDNYTSKGREGQNRYTRRLKSQIANSVRDYNRIDMNAFWKGDILDFDVRVHGETNNYVVTLTFQNILRRLEQEVKANNNKLEFKCVLRALIGAFNSDNDLLVGCTCPDWCLKEDTLIKLLDGTISTIKEVYERFNSGEKLYVYSTDENGDFKPGCVNDVWISGYSHEMVKVTLDNGQTIETTPNHRFMLRDGSYREAKDLEQGTSLMPLYFKINTKGYEDVKSNSELVTKFYSVYKQVAEELLQDEIEKAKERSGEDVIAIHHKDFNKLNNNPDNLIPMGKDEHYKYHYEHVFEGDAFDKWIQAGKEYWSKQESKDKQAEVMRETMLKFYANISEEDYQKIKDKIYTNEFKSKLSKALKNVWQNYTQEEYEKRCQINKENNAKCKDKRSIGVSNSWKNQTEEEYESRINNMSVGVKNTWKEHPERFLTEKRKKSNKLKGKYERTLDINKKTCISKIQTILNLIIKDGKIPSEQLYDVYRLDRNIVPAGYPKWQRVFNSWKELSNYYQLNHKVVKVEHIYYDEAIPVYDIAVEKYNNFYVNAGVILHNCYRQAYWATQGKYNSVAPQPSNGMRIANPNDTKGGGCKHVALVLSNLDWMMKIASVINNYIKWSKENMEWNYAQYIFPKIYGMPYDRAVQLSLFDDPNDNGLLGKDSDALSNVIDKSLQGRDDKGRFTRDNNYKFQSKPKETKRHDYEDDNALNLRFGDEEAPNNNEKELVIDDEEI